MKRSQIALLSVGGVLAGIVIASVVSARIALSHADSIDIQGATRLEGRDGRYDDLEPSVAGASEIDLRGIAVTDADLHFAGASNITLTMDGGALSGSMAGAGRIAYYGPVATETVHVAGAARVERAR